MFGRRQLVNFAVFSFMCNFLYLATPNVNASETQTSNSSKCSETPNNSKWKQIPDCRDFTPLKTNIGKDPLPYRENTDNSLIAIEGKEFPSDVNFQVLTPNQCTNPRLLVNPAFIDRGTNYLLFQTQRVGICQIQVTSKSESDGILLEFPVESWPVSVIPSPSIEFKKSPNLEVIQYGEYIQLDVLGFSYPASRYALNKLVPVQLKIVTPAICEIDATLKLKAIGTGAACEITLQTPGFAFGSRIFRSLERKVSIFFSKSSAQIEAEKKADKEKNVAIAKKLKEDEKLCSASDQKRLRNSYQAIRDSNKRYSDLAAKFKKASYLLQNGGKDQTIILSPFEFSDLLKSFPVLANTRSVPLYIYVSILEGAMIGENNNFKRAQKLANSSYQKASAGCKKVVGKP
jgi:hypothetical protein